MDPQEALFVSAKRGIDDDVVELLSGAYKVDVNKVDDLGNTALHYAAAADHTKTALLLINGKANIEARNKQKETPLHRAAARGALRTAKLLVYKGASLEAKDGQNMTPRALANKPELKEILTPGVDIKWEEEGDGDDDST